MVKEPTEEQSKILQQKGNIVITAKPGSGKTYTIVEKIARVIPDLPEYKGVIAISFTNKASEQSPAVHTAWKADGGKTWQVHGHSVDITQVHLQRIT